MVLPCTEGTAPSKCWIRRQCRRETERRRAGKRLVELTLQENLYFADHYRGLRGAFCFFGPGEKGTDWKGAATTFERAVTGWARALRLPWTAAAGNTRRHVTGAHTITGAAVIVFLSRLFHEQFLLTTYVTRFWSVAVLYILHEEEPPAILRDVVELCVYFLRLSGRRGNRGLLPCVCGSWFDCSFFAACPLAITLAALQTADALLSCVQDYCAFCTVQAVLQTATNSCTGRQ